MGPIDTHWHTFGYDVGMMNEFYELKPGETQRNVLMYNSPTVLLTDLGKKANFLAGETLSLGIYTSHYGKADLSHARLTIRLMMEGNVIVRRETSIDHVKNGRVSKLYDFSCLLPETKKPRPLILSVTMDSDALFTENEWELYLFPKTDTPDCENITVSEGMCLDELRTALEEGKDVLLLGSKPFEGLPTSFRIALAGRTSGNLATVISDHPLLRDLPHEGFCGWQFVDLLEGGSAVCFETDQIPFHPIIEVVSTHKYVIRQAALFEFRALNGRLLVCGFRFQDGDPAAQWLSSQLVSYMQSGDFQPEDWIGAPELSALANSRVKQAEGNTNFAFNPNDKTAVRRNTP